MPVPTTPPAPDQNGDLALSLGYGLHALREHGILWAINEHLLHGLGFELRITGTGDEVAIVGYGEKARTWLISDEITDDARRRFRQVQLDAIQYNNPGHWAGHSPGFSGRS